MDSLVPAKTQKVSADSDELAHEITAADGFAIVTGSVIGSGIFLVPATIATHLGSLRLVLAVWVVGGVCSLCGAFALAELGGMFPQAGGLYVYLREIYGRATAFLYGWGLIAMIQTGSIATLAAGFAIYVAPFAPWAMRLPRLLSVAVILVFTAANLMSLRRSKLIQMVGNAAKLAGLASIAVLLFEHAQFSSLAASWHLPARGGLLAFGIELVAVLWAYEGWHVVSFTGGEFKAPARDLPRSLIAGTLTVMAVYCILNVAYYCILSPSAIAAEPSVAAHAVGRVYGSIAARCVSSIVLVSILGALNGMILTGPRVFYAMARDGLFFACLGRLGKNTRVPSAAIIVQGIWASLLALAGNFEQLFTCVVFTAWIFYGLCVAGLIVARFRLPHQPRPFRTPLYPLVPILFVCGAIAVIAATILAAPLRAAAGLAAILSGLPFYFLLQAKRKRTAATLLPEESEA